jgi:hypothetical protein
MRNQKAREVACGAVVEMLEERRLMTVAGPAGSEIVAEDGAVLGAAWLDGGGIVHLVAGDGDDEVWVGHWGANNVFVAINCVRKNFAESDVRGFEVDCGAGDDHFSFWSSDGAVNAPVTVHGGAGNDILVGQDWLSNVDSTLLKRSDGPFAPITMFGDDGDDNLGFGVGEVIADGGAGQDRFVDSVWGKTTIRDDAAGGGTLVVERQARGAYVTYSMWSQGTLVAVPLSNGATELVWEDMLWTVKKDDEVAPEPEPQPAPAPTDSGDGEEVVAEPVMVATAPTGMVFAGTGSTLFSVGKEEGVWG